MVTYLLAVKHRECHTGVRRLTRCSLGAIYLQVLSNTASHKAISVGLIRQLDLGHCAFVDGRKRRRKTDRDLRVESTILFAEYRIEGCVARENISGMALCGQWPLAARIIGAGRTERFLELRAYSPALSLAVIFVSYGQSTALLLRSIVYKR